MPMRITEEEYAELMNQLGVKRCPPPPRHGASVAVLRGSDLPSGLPREKASVVYSDEITAWPGAIKPKRQKYGNRRVEIDGMKFDSQHEAAIYQELMLRVRSGELKYVCRQVKFDLPGGITYVADFVAVDKQDRIEGVYDAKSPPTRANRTYINKKKQMMACLGVKIMEV